MAIRVIEDLVYYNANSKDVNSSDCVKRSLSLAYDMDYDEVKRELNRIKRDKGFYRPNISLVYEPFMQEHGLISSNKAKHGEQITVQQFSEENPNGTYIVTCGEESNLRSSHMVCIIDGDIYDSWDCREYYVVVTYKISNNKSNMNKSSITEEDVTEIVNSNIKKIASRYIKEPYSIDFLDVYGIVYGNYTVSIQCKYNLENMNLISGDTQYGMNMTIKLNPRYGIDKNEELLLRAIDNNFKHYFKDMYKYLTDANRITDEYASIADELPVHQIYNRPLSQLPVWARPLVREFVFNGRNRGYYLRMVALPEDDYRNISKSIEWYASSIYELRDKLEKYKESGLRPEDYD